MSEVISTEAPTDLEVVVDEGAKPEADNPLGENGEKALAAEREARRALEKELKEFKDRDKTEAEKSAERFAELERENAELKTASVRAEVAAAKGVPVSLLSGSTQAELEASADALIQFRGEKQTPGLFVPTEGKSPTPQPSSDSEFVKTLFGSGD